MGLKWLYALPQSHFILKINLKAVKCMLRQLTWKYKALQRQRAFTATYALKRRGGEREVMGNNKTWRTTKFLDSANHFVGEAHGLRNSLVLVKTVVVAGYSTKTGLTRCCTVSFD